MFDENFTDSWIIFEAAEAADYKVLKCPTECGGMLFAVVTDDGERLCCELCGEVFVEKAEDA